MIAWIARRSPRSSGNCPRPGLSRLNCSVRRMKFWSKSAPRSSNPCGWMNSSDSNPSTPCTPAKPSTSRRSPSPRLSNRHSRRMEKQTIPSRDPTTPLRTGKLLNQNMCLSYVIKCVTGQSLFSAIICLLHDFITFFNYRSNIRDSSIEDEPELI